MDKCHIIQHGEDGFGHQLHGLFTTLILHNIRNFYFDGYAFCEKHFTFDHISGSEAELMKQYLIESINQFKQRYNNGPISYKNKFHAHEIYNISNIYYDKTTLYTVDNAYYFDRIQLTNQEKSIQLKNINEYKYFFQNKYLKNRLDNKNIVIHVRLGDAMTTGRGDSIDSYNSKLKLLMNKFRTRYPDHTIYLHSDGTPDFIQGYNYTFYGKETPLIDVLSDMIYSNILVCGNSSLSLISGFLGNQELIIVNDDNKLSVPVNTKKINDYLNE